MNRVRRGDRGGGQQGAQQLRLGQREAHGQAGQDAGEVGIPGAAGRLHAHGERGDMGNGAAVPAPAPARPGRD